jgi:hypothetical protein
LAAELGFWPATTDEADIEHRRQHNKNTDYWLARVIDSITCTESKCVGDSVRIQQQADDTPCAPC